jgi:threonine synthase
MEGVVPTLSPSMDIQISSNFERLLFDALGHEGDAVARLLEQLKQSKTYDVPSEAHAEILRRFTGARLDDEGTTRVIREVYAQTGQLIDPHTAVGVHAARTSRLDPAIPRLTLATAHPSKFPDAVETATGKRPALPPSLADLFERPECFTKLDSDLSAVKAFVRENARN